MPPQGSKKLRGHRLVKPGQVPSYRPVPALPTLTRKDKSTERMAKALRRLETGASYRQAARAERVSAERLRKVSREFGLTSYAPRHGVAIEARPEGLGREMLTFIKGETEPRMLQLSFSEASRNGYYLNAVGKAIQPRGSTIDLRNLTGIKITDVEGNEYELETRVTILRVIAKQPEILSPYKIVGHA